MIAIHLDGSQVELPELLAQLVLVQTRVLDLQPEPFGVGEYLPLKGEVVLRRQVRPQILAGQRRGISGGALAAAHDGRILNMRAARSLVGAWGEDSRNSFPKHLHGQTVLEGVRQRTAPDKFLTRLR